nr:tryptophan-rich sensory protein [bacterium]
MKACTAVILVVLSFLPGLSGFFFRPGDWYEGLVKPEFTPPGFVFSLVWPLLYLLMGIASVLAWRGGRGRFRFPWLLFVLQLALNALWPWIFFGKHNLVFAVVEILPLVLVTLLLLLEYARRRPAAGLLLVPYLL